MQINKKEITGCKSNNFIKILCLAPFKVLILFDVCQIRQKEIKHAYAFTSKHISNSLIVK